MKKADVIRNVAEQSGISRSDTEIVLNAFFDTVGNALQRGDKVQIVGFGIFGTRQREARIGNNPKTGGTVEITACKVPVFRAGKRLKSIVKEEQLENRALDSR